MRGTKKRLVLWGGLLGLAVGVLIVAGEGPAIGEDTAAAKLQAICTGRHTDSAKRAALEDLKVLDTSAAHAALEALTESKDQQVAVLATLTIGRAGYDGADEKLQSIYEDEDVSEAVRASALQAYARLAKAQGTSWEAIESYGKQHCGRKSRLEAVLMSTKNVVAKAE